MTEDVEPDDDARNSRIAPFSVARAFRREDGFDGSAQVGQVPTVDDASIERVRYGDPPVVVVHVHVLSRVSSAAHFVIRRRPLPSSVGIPRQVPLVTVFRVVIETA